ncbi:MAG: hypothetical protein ACI4RA_01705 [Kiritimatiellia bacterium]
MPSLNANWRARAGGLVVAGVLAAGAAPTATTNTLVRVENTGTTSTMTLFTADCWSDGQLPHAGADYLAAKSDALRLPDKLGQHLTFEGNSLQLGDDAVGVNVYHKSAELTFAGDGLFLKNGLWGHWLSGAKPKVHGTVTVLSKASKPFNLTSDNIDTGYEFTGAWHAAEDCGILLNTKLDRAHDAHRLILSGDLSDYHGRITVAARAILSIGNTALPGEIVMENASPGAGWLEALHDDDVLEVGSLVLKSGAKLMPKMRLATDELPATGSVVRVTRALEVQGPVVVKVPDAVKSLARSGELRFPLLTKAAAATGSLSVDDFALSGFAATDVAEAFSLDVATDEATGDTTLYLVRKPVIVQERDTTTNDPVDPADVPPNRNRGTLTTTNFWSDAQVPHPGAIYYSEKVARSYYPTNNDPRIDRQLDVFAGDALVLKGTLVIQTPEVVITNLYLQKTDKGGRASISNWHANGDRSTNTFATGGTKALKGARMVLKEDTTVSFSAVGTLVRFDAPIEGPGNIHYSVLNGSTSAYLEFAGDNSGWTGSIYASTDLGDVRPAPDYGNTAEIMFREMRNLGGPFPSFISSAVSLQRKAVLHPRQTVTWDDATRGVFVNNEGGGIKTDEGTVFTFKGQLTLRGTLGKLGAGTLVLGGRVAFNDGKTYDPGEGTYTIEVLEGGVRTLANEAADGVTFAFGAAGAIEADPEATGDAATYGLYDVKVDAPFGRAPNGSVPVRVVLPAGYEENPHAVSATICTVSAKAAANLGPNAFAVACPAQCRTFVTARANGDGTVTYIANVAPGGLIMTIR